MKIQQNQTRFVFIVAIVSKMLQHVFSQLKDFLVFCKFSFSHLDTKSLSQDKPKNCLFEKYLTDQFLR